KPWAKRSPGSFSKSSLGRVCPTSRHIWHYPNFAKLQIHVTESLSFEEKRIEAIGIIEDQEVLFVNGKRHPNSIDVVDPRIRVLHKLVNLTCFGLFCFVRREIIECGVDERNAERISVLDDYVHVIFVIRLN